MSEESVDVAELIREASNYTASDPDRARALLSRALLQRPFDADIHRMLGITESDAGNLAEAAVHLETATDLEPEYPRHWYDLGLVHQRLEQFEQARDSFETALTCRTDYVDALLNLGSCYAHLNEDIAACAAWGRCIDLDPTQSRAFDAAQNVSALATASIRRRRPPRHGAMAWLGRVLHRPPRVEGLVPMQRYLDCREALEESLQQGVDAFTDLLAALDDQSRGYWIVTQHLANVYFRMGAYEECHRLSAEARKALPCVNGLVIERYGSLIDFGKSRDAEQVYVRLMATLGKRGRLVTFVGTQREQPAPDWHEASVSCEDGVYHIRRGGNLFVVTSPGGRSVERQGYDRSDLILGPV